MVAMVSGEVPAEKTVNHTCDNPACVNPRHLYVGTHKENAKDRERRGRGRSVPPPAKQGEANANSKITCIIAKDIRTRALAGEPQKQIAAQYGVSAQTVSAIKTGIVWKHIETG